MMEANYKLDTIIEIYQPRTIEYPGYAPHTDTAKEALKKILRYKKNRPKTTLRKVDPPYINSLDEAENVPRSKARATHRPPARPVYQQALDPPRNHRQVQSNKFKHPPPGLFAARAPRQRTGIFLP